ncbi:eukaryotic translation initiation factor 4E-binding protein Mextli isoform X2 [Trichogramma pretiosum]|uniref:eukaryotic translation initiation factor 4E-binding protein Mextli isoform X2 n=1 Tax=Trichogramma pretiosum TaxID=7493 RepID=UPI0006C977E2|nr:eukaryotic translation initiation factor 4E-binding protein Mextli isoform X2 [Trichogramma pretiosum]
MATTANRPRTIKKLEKPRPLKISQRSPTTETRISVDDIVALIDNVASQLRSGFYDQSLQSNIVTMGNHLKLYSHDLEMIYKDQLDRAFVAIRNGSQDDRLDISTRVHLLELIELRAKQWQRNESMNAYYSQKLSNLDNQNEMMTYENHPLTPSMTPMTSTSPPLLGPGDVMKNSGKFAKPTRIQGKHFCKDEVVIRNSDSGKVNPGAKERLVQITGLSEDKIHYAKDLIKETIQRNASPVRMDQASQEKSAIGGSSSSLNSSASDESNRFQQKRSLLHSLSTNDASIGEYKYTVTVGPHSLKITGTNLDLVRAAKLVLDEYFSEESEHIGSGNDYFSFEEELPYTPITPSTTHSPMSAGQTNMSRKKINFENTSLETEKTKMKEAFNSEIETKKKDLTRELSYEFLMQCAKGPFARHPPADWERIQRECPAICRKVQGIKNNINIDTYKNETKFGIKNVTNNEGSNTQNVDSSETDKKYCNFENFIKQQKLWSKERRDNIFDKPVPTYNNHFKFFDTQRTENVFEKTVPRHENNFKSFDTHRDIPCSPTYVYKNDYPVTDFGYGYFQNFHKINSYNSYVRPTIDVAKFNRLIRN